LSVFPSNTQQLGSPAGTALPMWESKLIYAYREQKVSEIKEEIEQGSYTVDPKVVADAILRRLREQAEAAAAKRAAQSD
jgi:anti-sigma28 factor (negative regulator of flagellin synthesis)